MNGINYNTLMGNSGLYSNQSNSVVDDVIKSAMNRMESDKKTDSKQTSSKQTSADKDTYEHSTQAAKAGYDKPANYSATKTNNNNKYKALDSNGIQEGIQISDKAKALLKELREKFGNMDIAVAEWSTDEEQDYYASLSSKDYSVLINPELLEQMANDDEVKAKYMDILGGAKDKFDTLKSELGDDADRIKGFSITVNADGEVSYAVKLLRDFAESNKAKQDKAQEERIEERREERKRAEKERLEKIEADTIEDLIKAVKERLHPEDVEEEEEAAEKIVVSEAGLDK